MDGREREEGDGRRVDSKVFKGDAIWMATRARKVRHCSTVFPEDTDNNNNTSKVRRLQIFAIKERMELITLRSTSPARAKSKGAKKRKRKDGVFGGSEQTQIT